MVLAFVVARRHTEEAILAIHGQLPVLVDKYVPPEQAGIFISGAFNVMCTYYQEVNTWCSAKLSYLPR